jgi:carboxyl-terminal processing protease
MIGFDKPSPVDLRNGIESLVTQGMVSLVFDLRNNAGGLLKSAIDISEMFLSPDQIIVSTKGRIPGQDNVYRAKSSKKNYVMPLVILVNGSSASASEIVTGAIKDHKRGVIVGTKTYGKGSVQSVLPIGDGKCSLRLTRAKYYTPSGVCIHGTGIYPNVEVKISLEDEIRLIQKHSRAFKNMDLDNATEKEKKEYEKIKKTKDAQLDRAVDLLKAMRFISGDKFISLFESKPAVIVRDEKK